MHVILQSNVQHRFNRVISEGGNYFTPLGHDTSLPHHLKDSWRSKLEAKVQYDSGGTVRERNFHQKLTHALEYLHVQSRLENLNGEHWRDYWSSFPFEKCENIRSRGMIKNIAIEVVMLNPAIGGSQFSALADKAAAQTFASNSTNEFLTPGR